MLHSKLNILCTRMLAKELIYKGAAKNILIDEVSFIDIKLINTHDVNNTITAFGQQQVNAVFTSIKSVEAVARQLIHKPDWKIFCTGGSTKDAAIKYFGNDKLAATGKSATVLAEKIIAAGNIKEIVFFCGDQRLNELPETLTANQIQVKELVVYQNIATPQFITKNYDAVIFFSPSAVHSFFSVNSLPVNVQLFSIGKTTTSVIQTYCTNIIITSEWPGKEHMVDMVIEYYKKVSESL